MPKRYSKRKPRIKKNKGKKKHDTLVKMTGGLVDKGLQYASNIPGPVGVVARGLSLVKNLINVECKAYGATGSALTVTNVAQYPTAGYFSTPLNNISQGTGDEQRIGNSVLGSKFMIRYQLVQGATNVNQTVRMALVYDKKPDVGVLDYKTVYGSNDVNAYNDKDNSDRYVKLMDIRETLTNNMPVINKQRIINLARIHTMWDNIGNFEKGSIILIACSDQGANYPTLTFTSRYCFYDN